MLKNNLSLSSHELDLLKTLVGSTLLSYVAELGNETTLITNIGIYCIYADDDEKRAIDADLYWEDAETLSKFNVRKGSNAIQNGILVNQSIHDIIVARDTVNEYDSGEVSWSYVRDSAIIFILSNQVLCVSLRSSTMSVITTEFRDSIEKCRLTSLNSAWNGDDFSSSREFISVTSL